MLVNSKKIVLYQDYHPLKIKPEYVTNGESLGYIIECENKQTTFSRGDKLKVNIILFGNVIIYFSQILQALYMLLQENRAKMRH